MSAHSQSSIEVFASSVPEIFKFLESDFGFTLSKAHDFAFRAESPNCFIEIGLDWPSVFIALRQPYERKAHEPDDRLIGLEWVMRTFQPDLHYAEEWLSSTDQIPAELTRQAGILRKHCAEFLKGDFSRWQQVVECVKQNT